MARKSRNAEEYRQAAAIKLGRVLRAGEVVHHINLDHTDNRPENMHVCTADRHLKAHASANALIKELLKAGTISFDEETSTYLPDEALGITMPALVYVQHMSPREGIQLIKRVIHSLKKVEKMGCPIEAIQSACRDRGLSDDTTTLIIKRLAQNGEVYSPAPGFYKLASEG